MKNNIYSFAKTAYNSFLDALTYLFLLSSFYLFLLVGVPVGALILISKAFIIVLEFLLVLNTIVNINLRDFLKELGHQTTEMIDRINDQKV